MECWIEGGRDLWNVGWKGGVWYGGCVIGVSVIASLIAYKRGPVVRFPYETALEIFMAERYRRGVGLTGGQRDNAGITGALDLDLLAQAIRDNE